MSAAELELPYLSESQIEKQADAIREKFGQFKAPIEPVQIATDSGVRVFEATFNKPSTSGILRRSNGDQFEIFVNEDHSWARKRFTIAHELGHYFLHREELARSANDRFVDSEVNLYRTGDLEAGHAPKTRPEVQANLFAASLLMPQTLVEQALAVTSDIAELARLFGVSRDAIAIRLGLLDLDVE